MTVPKIKHKKLFITLGVIALLVLSFLLTYFIILKIGSNRLRDKLSNVDDGIISSDAYGGEADAYYKGKSYYYNENLVNILFIGVDRYDLKDKNDHQADVLYLVSADTKSDIVNIIPISRNTLTDIEVYDMDGEFLDTDYRQICLQYVYGKDDRESSLRTQKAVSRLLYDIPINGYYTIFVNTIEDIVDCVGGVNVTITEDLTYENPKWKKGSKLTINGKNAVSYLIARQESSDVRFRRQMRFVTDFIAKAKSAVAKDLSLPFDMYKKLAKNVITDVDATSAVYFASEVIKKDFNVVQIEGKVGFNDTIETFEVDETRLYETVLDVFYKIKN